ncbi:hypothetical protein C8R21_104106 [Nitrosospira multiformis]|uniref:Uncharacterized protein n=1 Tax=Nitrosospira multiformis TaxID=1231 RepID=A0A2T5IFJ3_9PROT|nr:hypothetical protein C8R21_104106 [Nitrosospira multiformis]
MSLEQLNTYYLRTIDLAKNTMNLVIPGLITNPDKPDPAKPIMVCFELNTGFRRYGVCTVWSLN